jgi:hypothetical protein
MLLLGASFSHGLAAMASLHEIIEDGSTDGARTAMGALGLLVIIALVVGIGQFMSGNNSTAR